VKLDIKPAETNKLQELPPQQVLDAAKSLVRETSVGLMGVPMGELMRFSPVVDGKYFPAHPFDPVAAPTASDVALLIGTNRDESALFLAADPKRGKITETELRQRLNATLGGRVDHVLSVYKKTRPNATPWDLHVGNTSEGARRGSIVLAGAQSGRRPRPALPVPRYQPPEMS
jgi:para-nitrobenzyl esterase